MPGLSFDLDRNTLKHRQFTLEDRNEKVILQSRRLKA